MWERPPCGCERFSSIVCIHRKTPPSYSSYTASRSPGHLQACPHALASHELLADGRGAGRSGTKRGEEEALGFEGARGAAAGG